MGDTDTERGERDVYGRSEREASEMGEDGEWQRGGERGTWGDDVVPPAVSSAA